MRTAHSKLQQQAERLDVAERYAASTGPRVTTSGYAARGARPEAAPLRADLDRPHSLGVDAQRELRPFCRIRAPHGSDVAAPRRTRPAPKDSIDADRRRKIPGRVGCA